VPEPDGERLAWMYRQMLRIREFEERVKATSTEHPGVIRGHTHLADGAEAPYSKPMEEYILPDEAKIVSAVREVLAVRM
jgi:TPP-dependent pyruvate/acetoin dehydrogenase alpha subunit